MLVLGDTRRKFLSQSVSTDVLCLKAGKKSQDPGKRTTSICGIELGILPSLVLGCRVFLLATNIVIDILLFCSTNFWHEVSGLHDALLTNAVHLLFYFFLVNKHTFYI